MELCASILADRLRDHFSFHVYGTADQDFHLKRPVFFTNSTVPEDGAVYVRLSGGPLPAAGNSGGRRQFHSLLVAEDLLTDEDVSLFDCALLFQPETDLLEVFNAIQAIFNLYDRWLEQLEGFYRRGSAAAELLDCSREIFGNPLLIHDAGFQFIAYSSFLEESDQFSDLIEKVTSSDVLGSFMEDETFRRTFSVREAAVFPPLLTGIRTLYKNIFERDKLMYRILAPEVVRPVRPSDLPLLDILAQYVQFSLLQSRAAEEEICTIESILYRLLDHQFVDDHLLDRTLSAYHWVPDNYYLCVKFAVDKLDIQNHTVKALVADLKRTIPGSCVFAFQSAIVMYVNLGRDGDGADGVAAALREFIRDNNLKAGISSAYAGFLHIYQLLYLQAESAMEVGLRYMPYRWIHRFQDVAEHYLLEKCTEDLPAHMVCAPEILRMMDYDEKHDAEYCYTLKVLLENNMQPVLTAKKLFIHRTTLLYRMEKMDALFHVRLSDPVRRFYYQLSLMLLGQADLHRNEAGRAVVPPEET